LLERCAPVARRLDEAAGGDAHQQALAAAQAVLAQPSQLPSARVLQAMQAEHAGEFGPFIRAQSERTRDALLALPVSDAEQQRWARVAAESLAQQAAIEAAETQSFEDFRRDYVSPLRLG
jgi:glutamate--cysteine ligase